jgi:hypothetical protein
MDNRFIAQELRKLADVLDPPEVSTAVPPPSARERAAALLAEFGAHQARLRQTGVAGPMSEELRAYVESNPPEVRAFLGGHSDPMSAFREDSDRE